MEIRKISPIYLPILVPVSLKMTAEVKWCWQHFTFVKTCELYIVHSVQCRNNQSTKCTLLSLRYLCYHITLNFPSCCDQQGKKTSRNQTRTIPHKNKL